MPIHVQNNSLSDELRFKHHQFSYRAIGLMSRVFTNGLVDRSSISGWVIPETQIMVLDGALLSTQHYKVMIKGKGEILGKEYHLSLHLGVVAIERSIWVTLV